MDLSITLCNLWVKKTTWRFIMTEKPTNNGFVCLDSVPVAQTTLTFYATDRIELTSSGFIIVVSVNKKMTQRA